MTCRTPTLPLDPLFEEWPAGEVIHVIHDTRYHVESFNPGVDASGELKSPTRFAPIRDEHGRVVPYLYGGSSLECAIFETVFHNVPIAALHKFVDLDAFATRGYGQLIPQRVLRLIDLTTDGLHRLKVPKDELINSPARDYRDTARWAQALYRQCRDADGLLWMSNRRDRDRAMVLFGDRVADALKGHRIGGPLQHNHALRQTIVAVALKAGIEAS